MWIFHPLGFTSVVADYDDMSNLVVRSRFKGDLEKLFPGCKVITTPKRDYRFRTSLPRQEVAVRYAELMASIDYDNFKDECPKDRHDTYLSVWSTMLSAQLRRIPWKKKKAKSQYYNDFFDPRFDVISGKVKP